MKISVQLIQAKIDALSVPTCTGKQSMIVKEIIDYQANHLFPALHEQIDAVIEDAFATGLLQSNGEI